MEQNKDNTKKRWKQIDYVTRQKIEVLLKAKQSKEKIAEIVKYSKRTIEREIKRGLVKVRHLRPDPLAAVVPIPREYEERYEYSAEAAQQDYEQRATAKGEQIKLGKEYGFCEQVASYIKQGYSPYSALQLIKHSGKLPKLKICAKTLYNYIRKDYIPGLTQADLPESGKPRKRGYNRVRLAENNKKGRSIEERPKEVDERETFGHWEMDCVEGKAGTKSALLVLSERLTRHELIFKLSRKTQGEVKRALDGLERELGIRRFRRIFKTVTCDNGCEFLNQGLLEKSISKANRQRTTVYYCHPYSAYERGTNENINKMIRRYIPKGTDIGEYSPCKIKEIQDRINSTPRLVLEGYPSNTSYQRYTA
jgi:IS30 family transposase